MLLFTNWFGTFLWQGGKVADSVLFPRDAREIARRLAAVQDSQVLREEQALRDRYAARPDSEAVEVAEKRLGKLGSHVRQQVPFLGPEDFGFEGGLLHEAMLILARERTRAAVGPDVFVMHAVAALDELNRQFNFQMERLREWHGAHFPEFSGLVGEERYLQMLCDGPERGRLARVLGIGEESVGADATEEDLSAMTCLAMQARSTIGAKRATEDYLRSKVRRLAPNTSDLVGELLAARLIALAGGFGRLAKMPSSTIQMLGAEKAFFKHVKDGARPPKHGAIFQHPLVHKAPYWQRGKVARALAGKISIAARVDFYRGGAVGAGLAARVETRARDVARQFPTAPKKLTVIRTDDGRRGGGERRGHGERGGWKHDGRRQGRGGGGRYGGRKGRDWQKGRNRRR